MKAALAAQSFRHFDPDNNGVIEAEDIVRQFARVDGVPWEKAHSIAHTILADADTGGELPGLNYIEYMTCLEGDAVRFDDFLEFVEPAEDMPDRERCKQVYEE